MRRHFLSILLLCFSIVICGKEYRYTTVPNDPMGVRTYTLSNGLKVFMSVNTEKPRVTAHIAVNTGSRNDPSDYTGLAHYLEHLMFKGSRQFGTTDYSKEKPYIDRITALYEEYSQLTDPEKRKAKYHEIDSLSQIAARYNIPNEYDKLMALIGSEGSNAYTFFDITCYTEDVPANELERWAKVQADRFQHLVMRGFHTELEAVYEEKNMSLTNDSEKSFDTMMAKLFPTHSYGTQTTLGTQEHLKNPSLKAIQSYYDRYYVPNNVAIAIAGDINPDSTIAIIDRYFGAWKKGNDISPRHFQPQPAFSSPQEAVVWGQEQENIMMGWRFKGAADIQNDTLQVMQKVLMNNTAGLIDLNINQKMTMQEAGSQLLHLKDYSVLFLYGVPNEGQSLHDIRQILLAEVEKLKRGDFDDKLLISIANNEKLDFLKSLDSNGNRVSQLVDSYINGEEWAQHVNKLNRMSRLTKDDIVAFAKAHLTDGYAYVEKRKGEDTTIKKIEKPAITPIPANREYASKFLKTMQEEKTDPIKPQFVDFNSELTFTQTSSGLPVVYLQNKDNDLFTLAFKYDFGTQADNRYAIAADYIHLLGTDKMTAEDIKKQFYNLACYYDISVGSDETTITLSGLQENMSPALRLLDGLLNGAVADDGVYQQYVSQTIKMRNDAKLQQRECFRRLWEYALHGSRNGYTDIMSQSQLQETAPSVYTSLIKGLAGMKHKVLYFGPATASQLADIIAESHRTESSLSDVPANKPYEWYATTTNEIIIAPYDAKNIYLDMLIQNSKPWKADEKPVIDLFNEYFGGGMNTIVFQELRETRGLAYNANAYYRTPSRIDNPEYTQLHIISQNDKMMDCINVFREITDNMPQNPSAFDIAKQSLTKSIAANRTTKFGLITSYLRNRRLGVDHDLNRTVYEALPKLTMQDVAAFEKANIARQKMRYVILGNEKELDMPALQQIGPIRRVSLSDIFGY